MTNEEILKEIDTLISQHKFEEFKKLCDSGVLTSEKYLELTKEIKKIFQKHNRLINFFRKGLNLLIAKYNISNMFDHKTLSGNLREEFIQQYLSNILPSDIEYNTGQIMDILGELSPQIDIMLSKTNKSKIKLEKNSQISFYENVVAIIEVKSELDQKSLNQIVNQNVILKKFRKWNSLLSGVSLTEKTYKGVKTFFGYEGIPNILLGYSGYTMNTLKKKLERIEDDLLLPTIIINLSRKYILIRNIGFLPITNIKNKYIEFEGDDILKYLFLFLNSSFQSYDQNESNEYNYLLNPNLL